MDSDSTPKCLVHTRPKSQLKFSAFDLLPTELIKEIVSYLSIFSKVNLQSTCKRFHGTQLTPAESEHAKNIKADVDKLNQFRHYNYNILLDEAYVTVISELASSVKPVHEITVRHAMQSSRKTEYIMLETEILPDLVENVPFYHMKYGLRVQTSPVMQRHTRVVCRILLQRVIKKAHDIAFRKNFGRPKLNYNQTEGTVSATYEPLQYCNDDWEMDDHLALILTQPEVTVDDLRRKAGDAHFEITKYGMRNNYKQLAERLPEFAEMLKIRELCYQARQTLKQEKVDKMPDSPHSDDDIRMTDLLGPLLEKDRHDIQLAMKQAREANSIRTAFRQNLTHALHKSIEFGGKFCYLISYMEHVFENTVKDMERAYYMKEWKDSMKGRLAILVHHPSFTVTLLESLLFKATCRKQVEILSILLTSQHAARPRIDRPYEYACEKDWTDVLQVFWNSGGSRRMRSGQEE